MLETRPEAVVAPSPLTRRVKTPGTLRTRQLSLTNSRPQRRMQVCGLAQKANSDPHSQGPEIRRWGRRGTPKQPLGGSTSVRPANGAPPSLLPTSPIPAITASCLTASTLPRSNAPACTWSHIQKSWILGQVGRPRTAACGLAPARTGPDAIATIPHCPAHRLQPHGMVWSRSSWACQGATAGKVRRTWHARVLGSSLEDREPTFRACLPSSAIRPGTAG